MTVWPTRSTVGTNSGKDFLGGMLSEDVIKRQLEHVLQETSFGLGEKYEGKVRDNYRLNGKRIIVTTDRISAFDRVLCALPFKGQVINQTAAFWFDRTRHIIDNHLIDVPDPNVLVAKECRLIPVEMVVRGYLTGVTTTSAWYHYSQGKRDFCGHVLPEGMKKNQPFARPIITPSTKAEKGSHDESISAEELLRRGLVDEAVYREMETAALALFEYGTELAAANNLILVDSKYEFGLSGDRVVLIDEIHTPDSSRFWVKDTYEDRFERGREPDRLDKEYVRGWLADRGFRGEGPIPHIPDEVRIEAARRYITAYEMITARSFEAQNEDVLKRITRRLQYPL